MTSVSGRVHRRHTTTMRHIVFDQNQHKRGPCSTSGRLTRYFPFPIHGQLQFVLVWNYFARNAVFQNQIQYILDNTYFNFAAYASNWDVNFVPSDGIGKVNMGNAIFSRWKIKESKSAKNFFRYFKKNYRSCCV